MLHAVRGALVAVLVPAALIAALAGAPAAFAVPCDPTVNDNCPEPGGGTSTSKITNVLTVTPPAAGTISGSGGTISCPSDCTHQDEQTVQCSGTDCDPPIDSDWDVVTLTASRGAGWTAQWTGCTTLSGSQCQVKLDADRTVSVAWADTQSPFVSLTSPANGATVGTMMSVSASASDNAGIQRVDFLVDGVVKGTAWGPHSTTISMSSYAHGTPLTVTARATDTSGNQYTSAGRTVTVDRQVNLTLGTLPAFTNDATVPLSIVTDADASTTCRLAGSPSSVPCSGAWSGVDASSPDGAYTYEVAAIDAVSNSTTGQRSFTLDRTDPVISDFDGPTEGSVVGTDRVTFTFAASDANLQSVRCKVGSAPLGPCTSATSHELTGLTDGTVTFSLVVTDKAGNETTRTRTFLVQRPSTNTNLAGGGGAATGGDATTGAGAGGGATTTTGGGASQTGGTSGPSLKANPARLAYRKQRRRGRTRLTGLRLTGVPRGATIKANCKGKRKGCPSRPLTLTRRSGTVRLSALAKRRLRKGAVVTVTVTAPGFAPKTMTVRI